MYGISYKAGDWSNWYLTRFGTEEEARKWLYTEEGDFRTREIYSTIEELVEDNPHVWEQYEELIKGESSENWNDTSVTTEMIANWAMEDINERG